MKSRPILLLSQLILLLGILQACSGSQHNEGTKTFPPPQLPASTHWDSIFTAQGLQNVQDADSTIRVQLRYSSTRNFIGKDLYGSLEQAYLRPEALDKLLTASHRLKEMHPDLRLLIYDAARPRRIQQILWDEVDLPATERPRYVADPATGSIHNYGCAIDLSLVRTDGTELDMGTDYDDFTSKAHINQEQALVDQGILNSEQIVNRKILRTVMKEAGFIPLDSEWWHFDAFPRTEVKKRFTIVE